MSDISVFVDDAISLLNELLELMDIVSPSKACDKDDHYCYMAVHFLGRQRSHVQSVLKLIPSRDVMLITRSMIEGWAYLKWTNKNKDKAKDWRFFAYVYDLIESQKYDDKERQGEFKKILTQPEFSHFFKDKQKKNSHHTWRLGISITKVLDEIATTYTKEGKNDKANSAEIKKLIYQINSEWHHWGVKGIFSALSFSDDQPSVSSFKPLSKLEQLEQLDLCINIFIQTFVLTSEYLNDDEMVKEKYGAILSKYKDLHSRIESRG